MATFDLQRVDLALAGTIFQGRLHHFNSIDSTQNRALHDAQAGAESGQVYIADEQTAGRGRGGHTWVSEPDRGLYLTLLARPRLLADDALRISLATGLAAQAAIEALTGVVIDLRWPNDLVTARAGSKKLGGILTETAMHSDGVLRHAAVGIGINLNQAAMPEDIASTATSLLIESGRRTSREELAIALLRNMHDELIAVENHSTDLFRRFTEASSWAEGKPVHVAEDGGYTGVTTGLTETGMLRVRCGDGTERTVRHGGVREQ